MGNIIPQEGFQSAFLSTKADIAIGGGAAGAGKTFAVLLEPLRHNDNPEFGAVIFRRTYPEITMEQGLWDESNNIYPSLGATSNQTQLQWTFPSGSKVSFRHLQHEKTIYSYQGAQIPLIIFDEVTHFTKKQFFYLLSRNRSTCGVIPYVRATCNPDPDSWVLDLIDWWIDDEGYPIPERSGVLRYMIQDSGEYLWGDSYDEVYQKAPHIFAKLDDHKVEDLIKTVTFIPGDVYGNKELISKNPQYLGTLLSLDEEEKQRLLHGNWRISTDSLRMFDYDAVSNITTNDVIQTNQATDRFITVDHARHGRDLCVIMAWNGLKAVKTIAWSDTDTNKIIDIIKRLKLEYRVPLSNIILDQDGFGVSDILGTKLFQGSSTSIKPKGAPRQYKNLRHQCYFKLAEIVNKHELAIDIDNIEMDGQRTKMLRKKNETIYIEKRIIKELYAVKREKVDFEGLKQIISKEQHKNALGGASPDFSDCLMMRMYFILRPPARPTMRGN